MITALLMLSSFCAGVSVACFANARHIALTEDSKAVQATVRAMLAEAGATVWVCKTCEGTGMEPSGGYTYEGSMLYVGGSTCPDCEEGFRR